MTLVHAGPRIAAMLRSNGPLRRLRTGVLVGFPSEIGFVRFIWLTKLRKRSLRAYEQPDENTQEMEYSKSWLAHYRPEGRVQWTMYLLASIPDCRKDSLLIIGPRYEPEIFMARGLGWAPEGVRGLDTFSYSPFVDVGDMHDLPYADGSFSAIVCGWTLSYSTRPEVAAKEMERVLSPGGYLVVSMQKIPEDFDEEVLPGVLHGSERIQTLEQLDRLYPGLERVAGFEPGLQPGQDGNTVAAYRKGA
jgi:hypothetical protein